MFILRTFFLSLLLIFSLSANDKIQGSSAKDIREHITKNNSTSDLIGVFTDIQNRYVESVSSGTQNPSDTAKKEFGLILIAVIGAILPLAYFIGVILIAWAIKTVMIDDPRNHHGALNAMLSGGFKFLVGGIFISSGKLLKWIKDVMQPNISSGAWTYEMFIDLALELLMGSIQAIGMVIMGMAIYKFSQKGDNQRDLELAKGGLMFLGGVMLLNIRSIILLILS